MVNDALQDLEMFVLTGDVAHLMKANDKLSMLEFLETKSEEIAAFAG